jgi:aspartate/methionine/tyrosine aminotransferase
MLCSALTGAGLPHTTPAGAYYLIVDLSHLGPLSDAELNMDLIDRYGIAGVPGSAFYLDRERTGTVRLCFAVWNQELQSVQDALCQG